MPYHCTQIRIAGAAVTPNVACFSHLRHMIILASTCTQHNTITYNYGYISNDAVCQRRRNSSHIFNISKRKRALMQEALAMRHFSQISILPSPLSNVEGEGEGGHTHTHHLNEITNGIIDSREIFAMAGADIQVELSFNYQYQ